MSAKRTYSCELVADVNDALAIYDITEIM